MDRAIKAVCDDLIRETECTRRTDSINFSANDTTLTISTLVTSGFRPERLRAAWVTTRSGFLLVVSEGEIRRLRVEEQKSLDFPEKIALDITNAPDIYPTPSSSGTVKFRWVEPVSIGTTWTDGDSGGGVTGATINIPDDYLRTTLMYGAPSMLQHVDEEGAFATPSWQKYVAFRDKLALAIKGKQNPVRILKGAHIAEN